jgi:multimeric flavodoxin WrbA
VYNGNVAPPMLELINSFDYKDDFTSKVGGSFATGNAVAAGVQPVLEQLNRGLLTFSFVVAGGGSWKSGEGVGVIIPTGGSMDNASRALAESQGSRLARLGQVLAAAAPPPTPPTPPTPTAAGPPGFGAQWRATVSANLTQVQ